MSIKNYYSKNNEELFDNAINSVIMEMLLNKKAVKIYQKNNIFNIFL